jgi:hypothetical protein
MSAAPAQDPVTEGQPAIEELRAWVRHPCSLSAGVGKAGGRFSTAIVVDLSVKGAGLIADQEPRRGELLVLNLRHRTRDFCGTYAARVVHVAQRPDGRWQVGCELVVPLSPQDLAALLP